MCSNSVTYWWLSFRVGKGDAQIKNDSMLKKIILALIIASFSAYIADTKAADFTLREANQNTFEAASPAFKLSLCSSKNSMGARGWTIAAIIAAAAVISMQKQHLAKICIPIALFLIALVAWTTPEEIPEETPEESKPTISSEVIRVAGIIYPIMKDLFMVLI